MVHFLFPTAVIYELAIDIVHTLGCERECMQQMLLSAVRHSIVDVSDDTCHLLCLLLHCYFLSAFNCYIFLLLLNFAFLPFFTGCEVAHRNRC